MNSGRSDVNVEMKEPNEVKNGGAQINSGNRKEQSSSSSNGRSSSNSV